jgi:UDP-N-acetylglucosamine 2-epimerase (hydrolysing)
MSKNVKKILFLTGTRADFGKLKSLMLRLHDDSSFEQHIFVTGMHMLAKYGYTCEEVEKANLKNIYKFVNQNSNDGMDHVLSKTIIGLSDFVKEIQPDLLVIHGDRVETLAGASVGALNNILVGHIECGEVSGTVDELIRHAVTKLSHIHFVANQDAKKRLIQLGENPNSIFVIGSPDIDVMNSELLPNIGDVQKYYEFNFNKYGILIFHPVTTELHLLRQQAKIIVDSVLDSELDFIVIYPNNDTGSEVILEEYQRFVGHPRVRMYPSMRFEFFLTLLKNAEFILGNSSAGIREAPHFGTPAINIGTRQQNRLSCEGVINSVIEKISIQKSIMQAISLPRKRFSAFGNGGSDIHFHTILQSDFFWKTSKQKIFIDYAG